MSRRMPIVRDMPKESLSLLMSEGNKSVYNLMMVCAEIDINLILNLDCMGMRGAQIFYAFAGHCGAYFPQFRSCVNSRDQEMIDYVNKKVPHLRAVKDHGQTRQY